MKETTLPQVGTFSLVATGLLCHLDDACISNPCHKGALCDTNPLNGQYICTCPQGYKGADCTEDVDECTMGEFAETCLFLMCLLCLARTYHIFWTVRLTPIVCAPPSHNLGGKWGCIL